MSPKLWLSKGIGMLLVKPNRDKLLEIVVIGEITHNKSTAGTWTIMTESLDSAQGRSQNDG